MKRTRVGALALIALCVTAGTARAQKRASELGSVSQVINGTTIKVEYSRPHARGRPVLFGERGNSVVFWGEVWTPGANWATTLEADGDVELNGQHLAKGKYSLWMIPQPNSWTVRVSRTARTYHTRRPDPKDDALTFTVKPISAPHLEILTFSFPEVDGNAAKLLLHWGTLSVPIDVKVLPPQITALAAGVKAQYVGNYTMRLARDTVRTFKIRVAEEGSGLRMFSSPMFFTDYEGYFDLIQRGDAFIPLMYKNGQPFDAEDLRFVFDMSGSRATGFTAYGPLGAAYATGRRVD